MSGRQKIHLKDICYARCGDKGNMANIGLMAFDSEKYELIKKNVTPERIKEHFGDWVRGPVQIWPMDNINTLLVLMHGALDGGVAMSLRFDGQGKSLGEYLRQMEIEMD